MSRESESSISSASTYIAAAARRRLAEYPVRRGRWTEGVVEFVLRRGRMISRAARSSAAVG